MNEIIGIIPHKFRRRGFGMACTLLLRAGLNFLGLAVLLPVLALALDARSLDGGGQLARIYTALGFTSPRSFALTVCAAVVAVIVLKCLTNLWLARIERNYIYDLYRTLSRRLYVTYHDRGLPFVKSSNSAVLARNVNVVCLAFTAGVLKPAAAIAAEALLLALLFGALLWYAPVAAVLTVAVFLPSIWIYYGWGGISAELQGLDFNYFYFKDLDPVFDYYTPVIIANNDFLAEHPDTAKAFLSATAKGYEYAIAHPEEAAQMLIESDTTGSLKDSAELVTASQKWMADQYQAEAERWGYIDPSRWNAFYRWLSDNNLVEQPIPENTGFSNDYLA